MSAASQMLYGRRLREARLAAKWTQPELGRCLGVDPNAAAVRISRYEKGQHMPDGPTMDALAKELRLPLAWFFADSDAIADAVLILSRLPKAKQASAAASLRASRP